MKSFDYSFSSKEVAILEDALYYYNEIIQKRLCNSSYAQDTLRFRAMINDICVLEDILKKGGCCDEKLEK